MMNDSDGAVAVVVAIAMFICAVALYILLVSSVAKLDGANGRTCVSNTYVHAASGQVETITVNGHTFTDVRCTKHG